MIQLTQEYINNFIKPNFYLLQNVTTFLLPERKSQFDFYSSRINSAKRRLSIGSSVEKVQHLVEFEFLNIERIFLTYLLSEELGTYFVAMANFPKGDVISTVLSKESYSYAHNFYQLSKYNCRDFFSRLMLYPFNSELRGVFNISDDIEFTELLNKVINLSCNYLWDKKESIRKFREQYKMVFNNYKHGMSILYNMKSNLKINLEGGGEIVGSSDSPITLAVKIDRSSSDIIEQWRQLNGFDSIEEDVMKSFDLIYNLFYIVVKRRIDFVLTLLESHKYEPSSDSFIPYKNIKLSLRVFNVSQLTEEDVNKLKEKFGITFEDTA